MTGKELLDKFLPNLLRIGPSEKNLELYQETKEMFRDFQVVDYFQQIKKNERGDGLALEMMLFDKEFVHDIVITRTTIDHITVLTNSITTAFIRTSFGESKNEKGEISNMDILTFTISIGGDLRALSYISDTKKFTEFQRIKTNLLKTKTT